jgi:protein-cysteine N-palmitoyltransferase HHAT
VLFLTRLQDNSDAQYRSFRSNIPYLMILIGAFFSLKAVYTRSAARGFTPSNDVYLAPFLASFAVIMITVLHGTSALKILAILYTNYALASSLGGSRVAPVATWVFNGGVLYFNERYHGYRFGWLHPSLELLVRVGRP